MNGYNNYKQILNDTKHKNNVTFAKKICYFLKVKFFIVCNETVTINNTTTEGQYNARYVMVIYF